MWVSWLKLTYSFCAVHYTSFRTAACMTCAINTAGCYLSKKVMENFINVVLAVRAQLRVGRKTDGHSGENVILCIISSIFLNKTKNQETKTWLAFTKTAFMSWPEAFFPLFISSSFMICLENRPGKGHLHQMKIWKGKSQNWSISFGFKYCKRQVIFLSFGLLWKANEWLIHGLESTEMRSIWRNGRNKEKRMLGIQ